MKDVVIVDNVRTGLAKSFRGSFNLTRSDDMVAHVIDALLERNPNVSPEEVEDVIVGIAMVVGDAVETADYDGSVHDKSLLFVWRAIDRFCGNPDCFGADPGCDGRWRRVDFNEPAPEGLRIRTEPEAA
jgi:acetyl-CoA acyltransferase